MPEKLDYLRDLADHPASTGAEAAARLDGAQPAVLQAFRRAVNQQLAAGDSGRPERFTITQAGQKRLLVLERGKAEASGSNPGGNPGQVALTALADLREDVADLQAEMRGVVRSMAEGSKGEAEAGSEGGAGRGKGATPEDNPGEPSARMGAAQRQLVKELFEARQEKASLGFFDDKGPVNERIARLKEQIPLGEARAVLRLRELETEEFRDSDGAEAEAAWLREKLGFHPAGNPDGEGEEGAEAEDESESAIWEEFFGSK